MSGAVRRRRWWRWTLVGVVLLAVIAGGRVTSAVFRIGLTAITVGGKPSPQFAASADSAAYPDAVIKLANPVLLPAGFAAGRTVTVELPGRIRLPRRPFQPGDRRVPPRPAQGESDSDRKAH